MKKILIAITLITGGCIYDRQEPVEWFVPPPQPLPPKYILPNKEYDLLHRKHRIAEKQIVIPKDKEFCSEKG